MRLHTRLEQADLYNAARHAGVNFAKFTVHGSRKAPRAFEVILTGSASHRSQYRAESYPAATWDEWGIFLAELYRQDPNLSATYYTDALDFHWQTDERFKTLTPAEQHRQHRWEYGVPYVNTCRCGAVRQWHPQSA
jgi:hypothetical protein